MIRSSALFAGSGRSMPRSTAKPTNVLCPAIFRVAGKTAKASYSTRAWIRFVENTKGNKKKTLLNKQIADWTCLGKGPEEQRKVLDIAVLL